MCRARHSPPRFSLCSTCSGRPMWTGDGFGALDTVLGRAGRKEVLGHAAGNKKMSGVPKKLLGDTLGDATGDF
jgi:hypothetical protein